MTLIPGANLSSAGRGVPATAVRHGDVGARVRARSTGWGSGPRRSPTVVGVTIPLRHGIFLAPFHSVRENPTLTLARDLELMELLDELGFAEAWIGEHHSAGMETIDSPEIFIAAAAERTKHLRFGTGV